jgi:uncharacterized protein YabN with tetrapyrrole methylase and pyrophosphatase domain
VLGEEGLVSLLGPVTEASHEGDEEEGNGGEDQVAPDEDAEQLDGLLEQPGAQGQENKRKDDGDQTADKNRRPGRKLPHLACHQKLQNTLRNHGKKKCQKSMEKNNVKNTWEKKSKKSMEKKKSQEYMGKNMSESHGDMLI